MEADLHNASIYSERDAAEDNPHGANLRYFRFGRQAVEEGDQLHDQIYVQFNNLPEHPLRQRGYVFWDWRRIETPAVTNSLADARGVSEDTILSTSWLRRRSVEARLQGVRILQEEKKRVVEEFGGRCYLSGGG